MKKITGKEPIATSPVDIAFALLLGVGLAFVALLLCLFLFALSIDQGHFTEEHISGMILASTVLSALLGGGFTVNMVRKYSFLLGLGVGATLFFILLMLGFIFYPSTSILNDGFELLFACLVGGSLAKIFSRKKKKNH